MLCFCNRVCQDCVVVSFDLLSMSVNTKQRKVGSPWRRGIGILRVPDGIKSFLNILSYVAYPILMRNCPCQMSIM